MLVYVACKLSRTTQNSKERFSQFKISKPFPASKLHTSNLRDKLKIRLLDINNCFFNKCVPRRYSSSVYHSYKNTLLKNGLILSKSTLKFINDGGVPITNVLVGGHIFQQSIGIPMETKCAPLLACLFAIFFWDIIEICLEGLYQNPLIPIEGFSLCNNPKLVVWV